MPCLVSPIRRHKIGSDDLAVPAAVEMISYIIWFICFAKDPFTSDDCFANYASLQYFYVYGFILMCFGFILSVLIFRTSLKGTVINEVPRRQMGRLVFVKLILDVATVGLVGVSTLAFFFGNFSDCDSVAYCAMIWRLEISWLVVLVIEINIWHWTLPSLKDLDRICSKIFSSVLSAESKRRLYKLFGFDDHSVLNGVVDLLMKFFKERVNVVPTDILVSLILIRERQMQRYQPITTSHSSILVADRPAWMNITLTQHYLNFAMASFGWVVCVVTGPFAVLKMISFLLSNRAVMKEKKDDIIGDNRLMTNTIGVLLLTGLSMDEIVHVSFYNRMFEIPFFVAIDRSEKSVVVSIRGSLSFHDFITDLTAHEDEILSSDDSNTISAHSGMLKAARKLYYKLLGTDETGLSVGEGLLAKAASHFENLEGPEAAENYHLVITGHSLGAGVAAVLTILLSQHEEYREKLRCFAYAPPGGLLSLSGAIYCEPFVLSVVLGDDLVPKLSISSIFDLKTEVLNVLKDCDMPKHVVIGGWLQEKLIGLFGQHFICRSQLRIAQNSPSWTKDEDAWQAVANYQRHLDEVIESTLIEKNKHSRLYLPGKILYIQQTSCSRAKRYEVHWLCRDAETLSEIVLSPSIFSHHHPLILKRSLDVLQTQTNRTVPPTVDVTP